MPIVICVAGRAVPGPLMHWGSSKAGTEHTDRVTDAYRYPLRDSMSPSEKSDVRQFQGCKYIAFKRKKGHTQAFVGPKLWKKKKKT